MAYSFFGSQNSRECFPFEKVLIHVGHKPSDSWCHVLGLAFLSWLIDKANGAG